MMVSPLAASRIETCLMRTLNGEQARPFVGLIARLNRRNVAVLILEFGAIGLLCACVVLIPLLAYGFWKHESLNSLAIAILASGSAAGIATGWLRRPSPLASALLADQQLGSKELLSTAWAFHTSHTRDVNLVLDAADHAARNTTPSAVTVRSLPSRMWGATVLAVSMVAVLCWMNPPRPLEQNQMNAATSPQPGTFALAQPDRPLIDLAANSSGPNVRPNPEDPNTRRLGQNDHSGRSGRDSNSEVNPSPARRDETNPSEGRGGGAGRTNAGTVPGPANDQPSPVPGKESTNGSSSGGSGTASAQSQPQGDAHSSAGLASASSPANQAPPWRSNSWPDNVQRAQQTISSGSVPAAYRDLIRGYFQSN
jgi:hypothetical protein